MNHLNIYGKLLLLIALLGGTVTTISANPQELLWTGCGISKLGFMKDLALAYEKRTGIRIKLEGGGATKGLRQVANGSSDLGGSCRLPLVFANKDGSYSVEASEQRIKLIPVGWDSLVVIVNKENQLLESISQQQLRDILTGKITHWKQLGANSQAPINLYLRYGKVSGVGLTLRQQLFNNTHQEFRQDAHYLPSSGKIEQAVEEDPYALAVSGVSSSRHRDLKILQLDGITADMENLKSGLYPLYRQLFLIAPHDLGERPAIKDFVKFALSPEGQKITLAAGTLPYHQGIRLIFNGTSAEYLHTVDIVEQQGIYTLSGQ